MEKLTRFWWLNLIRGLIALALGTLILASPKLFTVLVLVWLVGAYMLIDGILSIVFAFTHPDKNRWWVFIGGVLGIILASMVFAWPGMTAIFLLYFIAWWAIFTGIMQIIYSIANWKIVGGKVWLLIGGIISLIFGSLLLANPGAGALAVLWMIAVYLILLGLALIMFSIWLFTKRKDFAKAAGV